METTYTIKLGWFKKITKVKGHEPYKYDTSCIFVIRENEERIIVNIKKYKTISFSRGLYELIKRKAEQEAQAKVN